MSTKERIKSVLICVLLVGVVYLTYAVWFYNSPFGDLSFGGILNLSGGKILSETSTDNADTNRFGIRPMSVVLRDSAGARGAIYRSSESDGIYNKLRESLKSALAGAKRGVRVGAAEWNEKLLKNGVLCDYFGEVPASAVSKWVSGTYREDISALGRYFLLSADGKDAVLYIKNGASGEVWKYETGLSSDELLQTMSTVTAQKATLAAERKEEDFRAVPPEMPIIEGRPAPSVLSAYNPISTFSQEITESVLRRFKLSHSNPGKYAEQDGTQVYVADMVTLKISPNGVVTYSDTRDEIDDTLGIGIESEGEVPTVSEALEGARRLAEGIASELPGTGGIYLAAITETDGGFEIVFGRHVGGIPVDMTSTVYFVRIVTEHRSISSATVNLRSFDSGSAPSETMSERLAAAAMNGSGKSGELGLRYSDTGSGTVGTAWYIGGFSRQSAGED